MIRRTTLDFWMLMQAMAIWYPRFRLAIGNGGSYSFEDVQEIQASIRDELAGIEGDEAISITLDDKKLLFEYHPIKKEVTFRLKTPLESGDHNLVITAEDQVGNTSSEEIRFNRSGKLCGC